jgi:hypothetical protein
MLLLPFQIWVSCSVDVLKIKGTNKNFQNKNIMNTTKTMLFIGILLFATSAVAQTNYYMATKTFHESGHVYQADFRGNVEFLLRSTTLRSTEIDMNSPNGEVTLYNKSFCIGFPKTQSLVRFPP